jgi:hypothetical protein
VMAGRIPGENGVQVTQPGALFGGASRRQCKMGEQSSCRKARCMMEFSPQHKAAGVAGGWWLLVFFLFDRVIFSPFELFARLFLFGGYLVGCVFGVWEWLIERQEEPTVGE